MTREQLKLDDGLWKAINDYMYSKLPYPTYEDGDIAVKTEVFYIFFQSQFRVYRRVAV